MARRDVRWLRPLSAVENRRGPARRLLQRHTRREARHHTISIVVLAAIACGEDAERKQEFRRLAL